MEIRCSQSFNRIYETFSFLLANHKQVILYARTHRPIPDLYSNTSSTPPFSRILRLCSPT
ncbi:hypothetical protein ARMSODRAFT_967293, partial [Armillaria solidipes]